MNQKIQPTDLKELERLEQICILGRAAFYLVGSAFDKVKRLGLYKLKGFKTIGAWAESIGYSHQHANRLARDAKALDSLPKGMRELVTDEGGAHELAKLPEQLRIAIVTEATQGGSKPATAKEIKKHVPMPARAQKPAQNDPSASKPMPARPVAAKKQDKPKVKPTLDQTGFPVPPECLSEWQRGIEVQHLMTYVSSIRAGIKQAEESKDVLWGEVNFGSVLSLANQLYSELECARPHAVCPTCNGIEFKDCGQCKGRGFVSKFHWSTCVPEEIKAMRKAEK